MGIELLPTRLLWLTSRNEAQVKRKCKKGGSAGRKIGNPARKCFWVSGLGAKPIRASQVFDFSLVTNIFHDFSPVFTSFVSQKRLIFRELRKKTGINDANNSKFKVKNAKLTANGQGENFELKGHLQKVTRKFANGTKPAGGVVLATYSQANRMESKASLVSASTHGTCVGRKAASARPLCAEGGVRPANLSLSRNVTMKWR